MQNECVGVCTHNCDGVSMLIRVEKTDRLIQILQKAIDLLLKKQPSVVYVVVAQIKREK